MSNSTPLTENVENNYATQFGNIELFLRDQIKTVDFSELMENVERICQLENNGSNTLKHIHLLVKIMNS